jgi:predicted MFS family arabinose efflux permease
MNRLLADYLADLRLMTRNVKLFLLGGLLIGVLAAFMFLLLNLYLKDIGFGETFIGRVLAMFALGGVIAAIPSAYFIARYKLKPLLIGSTLLLTATFAVLVATDLEALILSTALLLGMTMTLLRVAGGPFIMRNSSKQERTLLFSLSFANFIIAGILGSLGGGWLQKLVLNWTGDIALSYRYTLWTAAAIATLAIIPFSLIKAKAPLPDEVKRAFNLEALRRKWRLFFRLIFPHFLLGCGAGLIIPFLNLYFRDRFELTPPQIGIYYSMLQATMLIAVLAGPILRRRFGFIRTVTVTELLSIPFMVVLCYTEYLPLAVGAFLLRGALMNMAQPVSNTFAMEAVQNEDHGLINSLISIAWTSSWAISAPIGGYVIERFGFVPSFWLAIGFYIASAAFYYFYFAGAERAENGHYRITPPGMH